MDPLTGTRKNWSALNWKKIKNILKKILRTAFVSWKSRGTKRSSRTRLDWQSTKE